MNSLYKLTINDIKHASEILGKAFLHYPTFEYVFPNIDERKKNIAKVLKFLLKCGIYHGEVVAPSNKLEGISIWYKSDNLNFPFTTIIKSGIFYLLFSIKMESLKRFITLGNEKKIHRKNIIKGKYYFLDMIGVDPELKNIGFGKVMIQKMLDSNKIENLPCYLETSNRKNIKYYEKYGFRFITEYSINNLKTYCMIKD